MLEWIASGGIEDLEKIKSLNGFVWSKDAVSIDWSRRQCLEEMVRRGIEAVPVVKHGKIEGIVERSQLVSSLIVDVAARLED